MRCQMSRSRFSGSTLERSVFYEADLTHASFAQSRGLLTTFYHIDLRDTALDGMQCDRLVFFQCDQRGKDYSRQGFTGCQFTDCPLDGAKFNGAQLTQCNFKGASLREAEFNQVNASQALFMEADLRGAQCRGSLFDQAIFVGAILEQADFSQSRLFQSVLQQVQAPGA
ncbi:pentapeptide repeat-containing protein, partial [Escherichia coli]